MPNKRDYGPRIVNERVAKCRVKNDWSQKVFGLKLSELSPKENEVSQSMVSMWETRDRAISMVYLEPLSQLFGVTKDYLLGLTDDEQGFHEEKSSFNYKKDEIEFWELYAFDKQPVYVDFSETLAHENGWAIYNRSRDIFVFSDDIVKVVECEKNKAKYYVSDISRLDDPLEQKKSFSMQELLNREPIYIQMITTDRSVRSLYDGWYHHNENKTALINNDGLVLPYSGLKKAYLAYGYSYDKQRARSYYDK